MKPKVRLLTVFTLGCLISAIAVGQAIAGGGSKTVSGSISGITYFAEKSVYTYTTTWTASVKSQTVANVSIIGYTWWTVYRICTDDVYAYYSRMENKNNRNSNYYEDIQFIDNSRYSCNPGYYVKKSASLGNHQFTLNSTHQYPYVEYVYP
ncbi:MAG: hypothetical protein ROW48_06505 [Bellilinea sp.]|jgi:hypothetical protein